MLSSPRKFKIADIPLLLEFLPADNASLFVLPETHLLASLNISLSSKVLVYEEKFCGQEISAYQFLATKISYISSSIKTSSENTYGVDLSLLIEENP